MNLRLSPELEKFVDEKVKTGEYATPEDVVRAALVTLRQQEGLGRLTAEQVHAAFPGLGEKIAQGIADANSGKLTDGDEFFDELEREDGQGRSSNRRSA